MSSLLRVDLVRHIMYIYIYIYIYTYIYTYIHIYIYIYIERERGGPERGLGQLGRRPAAARGLAHIYIYIYIYMYILYTLYMLDTYIQYIFSPTKQHNIYIYIYVYMLEASHRFLSRACRQNAAEVPGVYHYYHY